MGTSQKKTPKQGKLIENSQQRNKDEIETEKVVEKLEAKNQKDKLKNVKKPEDTEIS